MDTHQITELYMQRPQAIASWGLGQWFAAAFGLLDKQLVYSTTREAKQYILDKYIGLPDLTEKLILLNRTYQEK